MDDIKRKQLIKEASMQAEALKWIGRWRTAALFVSALGVLFAWYGLSNGVPSMIAGILGILMTVIGFALAVVFNLGIRNGSRNVEKILNTAESDYY